MILLCYTTIVTAQDDIKKRIRLYEAWVSVQNNPMAARGVLYEIRDSSILLSDSKAITAYTNNSFKIAEINIGEISTIKARRTYSQTRGALIGGAILGTVTIAAIASIGDEIPAWYYLTMGTTSALLGSGIGALLGSIKKIIPINGDIGNFNSARPGLEKLSYFSEYSYGTQPPESAFQYKSYIAILVGPSIPLGDFSNKSEESNSGNALSGYTANVVNAGYRITPRFGISAKFFDNQYDVEDVFQGSWWGVTGMTVGPMFSAPIGNKLYFDLKPEVGFADAQLQYAEVLADDGSGFAINLNASLIYNFARRWCAITEAGYFSSNPKFTSGSEMSVRTINLAFGIGYRFW